MRLNIFALLALGLTIVVLFLTNWGIQLTKEKEIIQQENQIIQQEKEVLSTKLTDLETLKIGLEAELDTLMNAYGQVKKENGFLKMVVKDTNRKLGKTERAFNHFKAESNTAILSLRESIKRLVQTKSTLEVTIKETTKNNDALLDKAGISRKNFDEIMQKPGNQKDILKELKKEYAQAQAKRKGTLADARIKKIRASQKPRPIILKTLKATGFRTVLEMKNGKATVKGGKVNKILVSFDLEEVPDELLGEQELFLVIKNGQKKVIREAPISVNVKIKGLKQPIKVIQVKKVELEKNQRIRFRFGVEKPLRDGYYSVAIYTKEGLLGKTSFKVE